MMDYSVHMIARAEHNLMVRSLPRVPEYGERIVDRQPHWLLWGVTRLLSALNHESVAPSNPMKPGRNRA